MKPQNALLTLLILFVALILARFTAVAAAEVNSHRNAYAYLPGLPPIANDDVYTTTEDIPLAIPAPGVLANDTEPDGDPLGAALSASPSQGTVQLNSDGSFVYTPTLNYNGTDSFTYVAYDALPLAATAYWPFDDMTNPTADASGNGHDGALINGPVFSVDTPITYTSAASLQFDGVDDRVDAAGTISLENNSFTVAFWAKRSTLSGNSDFAVGLGTSSTANNYLHIGFRPTNSFTCAFWNNDLNTPAAYTDLDWHHWACVYDAATNYRAIYRDGVLIASDTATADFQGSGTFTIGARGTGDNFAGNLDDVRVYNVALPASEIAGAMTTAPGTGLFDTATVNLTITSVEDVPIAVDDTYTTTQTIPLVSPVIESSLTTQFTSNNSQDGNMFNVTAGPHDIHLTGFDINVSTSGAIEIAVYYKQGTYAGSEQTPGAWTHLGMFTVNAQGQNNPTFLDISSAGGLTIPAGELYGLYLSVTDTALSFRYTNGTATYSNADLTFTSGTGNPYPFGSPIASRIWNGTIYYEINIGVLANDSDAETPSLTAILNTNPNHGVLALNSNGSFIYTPTLSFCGLDTFTYYANDGLANSNLGTASIDVACLPPAPPIANDDVYTTTEDIPLTLPAPGVLANDTDGNYDVLTATLLAPPSDGAIVLNPDGSFTYTPDPNFNGVDTFIYQAADDLPAVQGYWPFEDGTNPTADESGHGYNGTLVNGTTFVSTTPVTLTGSTQALSFDGADDRVDIPGPITLANQSFSVAFWAKRNAVTGNTDIIFGQGTGGNNQVLHIGFRDTDIFTCAFWNNDLNTPVAYTDLDWHHWACTYDAATNARAIYRDGGVVASDTASADYQGSGTAGIGHRNSGDHFNGLVDDMRLYYGALSAAEVQAAMGGETPGAADTATVTLNVTPVNDAPIAVDDAYTTQQGTPLVLASTPGSQTTTFAGGNGSAGNMFDVTAGDREILITGFDIHVDDTSARTVEVYYKAGSYVGFQQTPGAWTMLGTEVVTGQGIGNPTPVSIGGLTIPAGETYGLYVTLTTSDMDYTNGANTYSNGDLTITTGTGNAYPFASVNTPRTWNGTIYYEVSVGVIYNDLEIDGELLTASLSTSPSNGALIFNSDGTFIYTPTISFAGVDTFDYIASDGTLTDTATVSITVTAVPCLVETTGDNLADYASADESALQTAVNNATPGALIKVAGTCAGAHLQGGETQTVYISQTLTIQGGYTNTNWLAAPDPIAHPTRLDARGGGRVVYVSGGAEATLNGLILTGGNAVESGGGLYNDASTVVISNTQIVSNTSAFDGGGISNFGDMQISQSVIAVNNGRYGGGIRNGGEMAISNSTIAGNESSQDGGGILSWGTLAVTGSTITNNTANDDGGGIANVETATLTNSTISGNTALGNVHGLGGGGIYQYQDGAFPVLTLIHTTIVSNTNAAAGGDGLYLLSGGADFFNSLIAHNGDENCGEDLGSFGSGGYNLEDTNTCGLIATGDLTNTVSLLNALSDNGGNTLTHLPLPFSPAIDGIPNGINGCGATITTDQRGVARPVDATCDIGAVEVETNFAPVAVSDAYTTTEDSPLTIAATSVLSNDLDGDWDILTATLETGVSNGTLTLNADGSFDYTPDENFCGTDGFTYHAADEAASSNTATVTLTVTCVNDAPQANDDAYTVATNTQENLLLVLNNDTDVEGDTLAVYAVGSPDQGGTAVNNGTDILYSPAVDFIGTEAFTYTVSDGNGGFDTATVTMTVSTLPVVDAGENQTVDEGDLVSFAGNYIVFPPQATDIAWDFGDGATATGTLTPTHTYANNGTFTVTLTITGTDGVGTDTLVVTVLNVAPTLATIPNQNVGIGEQVEFTAVFTDPGLLDSHTATVDWGDGQTTPGTVNQPAMSVSSTHSYTAAGVYTVTVTLTDDDGAESSTSFTVTVTAVQNNYMIFLPVIVR
ncbi:MAG: tandem-95 repeat protein [Anaerolineae bacterium]|nr:tandem-95 repeat protein [Anaerolineae bacterium]